MLALATTISVMTVVILSIMLFITNTINDQLRASGMLVNVVGSISIFVMFIVYVAYSIHTQI